MGKICKLSELEVNDIFTCTELSEWGKLKLIDKNNSYDAEFDINGEEISKHVRDYGLFFKVEALNPDIHSKLVRDFDSKDNYFELISWVEVVREDDNDESSDDN